MTFTLFTRSFDPKKKAARVLGTVRQRGRGSRSGWGTLTLNDSQAETVTGVLDAVQTVIDSLGSPSERYIAAFTSAQTPVQGLIGGTSLSTKRINVTSAPLFDDHITLGQAAEVLTGIVAHEVGHTKLTLALHDAFELRWGKNDTPAKLTARKLSQVLEDVRLERWMSERYPGVSNTFRPTAAWVGRYVTKLMGQDITKPISYSDDMDMPAALGFMVKAVRYPFVFRWLSNAATRTERQWWQDWAEQYSTDVESILEGIDVGLERLRRPEPPAPDEPSDDGDSVEEAEEPQPESDDDGDGEPGDDDEDGDDDWDEDEDDEPEDGDSKSGDDDEGNADEGDEAESGDDGDDTESDDADSKGGNDSLGATKGGTNSDESDQLGDETSGETESSQSGGSAPEGGNPAEPSDEPGDESDDIPVSEGEYGESSGAGQADGMTIGDAKPELVREDKYNEQAVPKDLDDLQSEQEWNQQALNAALQKAVEMEREAFSLDSSKGGFGKQKVRFHW